MKKIAIIGIIMVTISIIIGLIISNPTIEDKESELPVIGDIIMPTKVSRPGCEKIDRCYVPSLIIVASGKQVTWVNEDSAFHSVTSGSYDTPTELFDSGYLDPFESYTLVFDKIGTYDYFCTLHPWMKGQVVVQ